jgi:MoxR-like ATPase
LEKNISIDSNNQRHSDGQYGQFIASALFTQHYFEHTLGWDFDTVWQWDAANNRPALRAISPGTAGLTPKPTATAAHTTDLLTRQIRANLWL